MKKPRLLLWAAFWAVFLLVPMPSFEASSCGDGGALGLAMVPCLIMEWQWAAGAQFLWALITDSASVLLSSLLAMALSITGLITAVISFGIFIARRASGSHKKSDGILLTSFITTAITIAVAILLLFGFTALIPKSPYRFASLFLEISFVLGVVVSLVWGFYFARRRDYLADWSDRIRFILKGIFLYVTWFVTIISAVLLIFGPGFIYH